MPDESVRRSLYILFGRLLSGPPDAALYLRLHEGGLERLAAAQGVDLTSDLLGPDDADGCAAELRAEYDRLGDGFAWRASEYEAATADPAASIAGFLREHGMEADPALPCDHLSIVLNIMGELAAQEERRPEGDAAVRAPLFFRRHLDPWAQRALAELSARADRKFYRGIAAMASAFLESERRRYEV